MKSSDKNRAILAEVVARSWRDEGFRKQLKGSPKKILQDAGMSVAKDHDVVLLENTPNLVHAVLPARSEMGAHSAKFDRAIDQLRNLPDDIEVRVVRDTAKKSYVVLPAIPAAIAAGELSDADLEQVAGGKSSTATYEAEVAETSAVQTEEAVTTTTEAQDVETTSTAVAEVEVALVPCFIV